MANENTLFTQLGTIVSVSDDVPATLDTAGFEAASMTYIEVGGVLSSGDLSDTFAVQTATLLKTGFEKSAKGARSIGAIPMTLLGSAEGDAGYAILKTNFSAPRDQITLKIVDSGGDIVYLHGFVSELTTTGGDANAIKNINLSFKPNELPAYSTVP